MTADFSKYRLEGDNSAYRLPNGLVAPVVTRRGLEDGRTAGLTGTGAMTLTIHDGRERFDIAQS